MRLSPAPDAKPKPPFRRATKPADGEAGVREKIAAMPGYAKDGPALCFFRADEWLMTFGLTLNARHEPEHGVAHGPMASSWFFTALDAATEAKISEIVRRATA